jgi:hypothetical protein
MIKMNQYIYHIDDLQQMNDTNIGQYLEDNLFVLNHMDDNHMLLEFIIIIHFFIFSSKTYEYILCYYVLIYVKIPNIHFHNVNNSVRQQLVDNNKNLLLDHMTIVMNQLNDNYNILSDIKSSIQI